MSRKLKALAKFVTVLFLLSGTLVSCDKDDDNDNMISQAIAPGAPNVSVYALSDNNQLLLINPTVLTNSTTVNASGTVTISGLQSGEKIMSIDFRPATGQLYGLGNSSRIYVIDPATGAARAIGTGAFSPAINGTAASIDFNPTVDRIRLVTNTGQNLRLNPETGTVAATDGNINGVTGATVTAVAYTNNVAGATTTTLYDIDVATDKLYRQDPPNDGKLTEVGALNVNATDVAGFDILVDDNIAIAALTVGGATGLYNINTALGNTSFLGNFPTATKIIGLAVPTRPVAYAVDVDNNFVIFNPSDATQAVATRTITGLQAGERIRGIDMRPANGQLYGLGSTGRLYTFNLSTGAATVVGATPLTITGTDFGFDFNPTVDRIRVISNTGQNLRINPNDGTLAATDLVINPGTPVVTAAAYTNNVATATTTVLYDIDTNTDRLYRQEPPNNGTLVDVGSLTVNATNSNGFDIGGTSGTAYAILTVGTTNGIYTINLTNGAATRIADFPRTVTGMAIGLGF